jgi:hypothetical protein
VPVADAGQAGGAHQPGTRASSATRSSVRSGAVPASRGGHLRHDHLLRYEDVRAAHVDARRFLAMETAAALAMGWGEGAFYEFQQHVVLTQNPPRHTRVLQLQDSIRAACEQLIGAMASGPAS